MASRSPSPSYRTPSKDGKEERDDNGNTTGGGRRFDDSERQTRHARGGDRRDDREQGRDRDRRERSLDEDEDRFGRVGFARSYECHGEGGRSRSPRRSSFDGSRRGTRGGQRG